MWKQGHQHATCTQAPSSIHFNTDALQEGSCCCGYIVTEDLHFRSQLPTRL